MTRASYLNLSALHYTRLGSGTNNSPTSGDGVRIKGYKMCDVLRMFWLIIIYNVSLFPPFVSIPLALPHLLTFLFPKSGFSTSLLLCKLPLLQRPFLTILSKVAPLFILSHLSFLSLYPSQFAVVHLFALITCSLSFSRINYNSPVAGSLAILFTIVCIICVCTERGIKKYLRMKA